MKKITSNHRKQRISFQITNSFFNALKIKFFFLFVAWAWSKQRNKINSVQENADGFSFHFY